MKKNILIIGAGGREHAIARAIHKSKYLNKLYYASGSHTSTYIVNPAMADIATSFSVDIQDGNAIFQLCKEHSIEFVVIGPEAPLVAGVSDILRDHGIIVCGPSKAASQLESSKHFTKQICSRNNIPTAHYASFITLETALAAIKDFSFPLVIKADGLAAGKGVIIAQTNQEACNALEEIFDGKFGSAGNKVLLEEFLDGEEVSFFVATDGEKVIPLTSAQDHKRAYDGDKGPNTGGMGAYSPAPIMTEALTEQVMQEIILPTLEDMRDQEIPYKGILYAGLMICHGKPFLIEYNARFGDPECQIILERLESDVFDILYGASTSFDDDIDVSWSDEYALTVVMAAKGYPDTPLKGTKISLPEMLEDNVTIYHAGTILKEGTLLANGGRVLNITAKDSQLQNAFNLAYKTIKQIDWPESFYRKDIGSRLLKK